MLLASSAAMADGPEQNRALVIGPDFSQAEIVPHSDLLHDPTNQLTIDQVTQPPWSGRFEPQYGGSLSRGLDISSYWFRFRLEMAGGRRHFSRLILAVTRPLIPVVEVFVPTLDLPPGEFRRLSAGIEDYGSNRDLGHRIRALPLPREIRPGAYIYVRVRSKVAYYALTLFSPRAFDQYNRREYLFFGLCTGIMLAMLLYNLAIAAFLRDRVYAAYCAYMASMIPYSAMLTGWPLGLGLHPQFVMDHVLQLFSLTFILAALFARAFLATKGRHPLFNRLLWGVVALSALNFVLTTLGFWDVANAIAYLMGMGLPIIMIGGATVIWRGGYSPARYYVVAWSVLFIATMVYAGSGLGIFAYSFMIYNIVLLGAAAEAILLSLALADRIRVMRRESSELRQKERRLTELSITDELTGLYNKRWFSSKLNAEVDHAHRLDLPLSLLIADVDHFKLFNDTYGHAIGDKVLALLGDTISQAVRDNDIPCRYGGEEFAVILPGHGREHAAVVAERLRSGFARQGVSVAGEGVVGATISVGVAQLDPEDGLDDLFERADRALYQAKAGGRDQVVALG